MAGIVFDPEVNVLLKSSLAKKILAVALVALLAAGTAWGLLGTGDGSDSASESAPGSIPDVVAEVNGEEIPKEDYVEAYEAQEQAVAQQAQAGGQQPDEEQLREQVVQSLVTERLLTQEADRREIEPTDAQVQKTLTELARQNGMKSADQFVTALEDQGLDREKIDEQAALQTKFDLLMAEVAGPVKASDQEVRALYKQLKAQQSGGKGGQQVPPLADVRPQLVEQVESQEESEAARKLIDQLREDADITLHV